MFRSIAKRLLLGSLIATLGLSGCGYSFQTSKSPLSEKEGIQKIYVMSLVNNTYKAGVENAIYNALVRTISVHRRVKLVNRESEADAILKGNVTEADYSMSAPTSAQNLTPAKSLDQYDKRANVLVATEYTAALVCSFSLVRTHPSPGQRDVLWSSAFSRTKPFASANQLGTVGDTSALINESEFDRALSDLADSMMADVHESMLAMF